MQWVYDDGGRAAAGYRGHTRDCVVRAVAIATGLAYQEVYGDFAAEMRAARLGRAGESRSPRDGVPVHRRWFREWLAKLGWEWHPTMTIASGCRVHLRAEELPSGNLIVRLSGHVVAVIDGVIHDTSDPSRHGTRCVYGYWRKCDGMEMAKV